MNECDECQTPAESPTNITLQIELPDQECEINADDKDFRLN